jgi:hypothetical protein
MSLRFTLLLALLLLIIGCGHHRGTPFAQATPQPSVLSASSYPNLEVQANQITDAFIRKDYERYAELTYVTVVQASGAKEKYAKTTEKNIKEFEATGQRYLSYRAEPATQLFQDAGNLYAVVPTVQTVKSSDGTFRVYSYMIGVSSDNGQNWTFFSVGAVGRNGIELVLGQVASKFDLPPDRKPVKLTDN